MLQQLCCRYEVRIWYTFSRTPSSVFCPSTSTTSSSTCFSGTGCCLSQQPVSSGKLMRDLSSSNGGLQKLVRLKGWYVSMAPAKDTHAVVCESFLDTLSLSIHPFICVRHHGPYHTEELDRRQTEKNSGKN